MVTKRDWQIGSTDGSLRLRGLRGGTVAEITSFLNDMESAYNSLCSLNREMATWHDTRRYWPSHFGPEEFGLSFVFGRDFHRAGDADQVPPEYRLELKRVSIQSPGSWEFVGGLNPLLQLREYLKDRHERRKDREYRECAEKERLRLDNELLQKTILEKENSLFREHLSLMKEAGIGEDEIRWIVWSRVGPQLSQLGQHQDKGLIEGPADEG